MNDGQPLMSALSALDRFFARLDRAGILGLATAGVLIVGAVDYGTGYELSMSLFYLGPVAAAAWYGGDVGRALLSR